MKIITRAVYDLGTGKKLEEESYEYTGLVARALGGGGGGDTTTVQQADPWEGQQPFLTDIFQQAQGLYQNNPLQYYPNQTYAGQNPLMYLGQGQALGAAAGYTAGANQMAALNQYMAGMPPYMVSPMGIDASWYQDPNMNPAGQFTPWQIGMANTSNAADWVNSTNPTQALQQLLTGQVNTAPYEAAAEAAQRGYTQSFQDMVDTATDAMMQQVIPGIESDALLAGQYGGSREGIAEGIAGAKFADEMQQQMQRAQLANQDIASNIFSDAFTQAQQLRGQGVNQAIETQSLEQQRAMQDAQLLAQLSMANANNVLGQQQLMSQYALGQGQLGLGGQQLLGQLAQAQGELGLGQQQLQSDAIQNALQNSAQMQALWPSLAGIPLQNSAVMQNVGYNQMQEQQAAIDEAMARWNFEQMAPYTALAQYQNFVQGQYGLSSTATTSTGGGGMLGVLGGGIGGYLTGNALAGTALGGTLGEMVGGASMLGPLGAFLGILGSIF